MVQGAGINKSHGSSICLVGDDGQPLFCAMEERFTRVKLQRGMPHRAFEHIAGEYDLDGAPLAIARLGTRERIRRELDYVRTSARKGLFAPSLPARLAEVARLWTRKKLLRDRDLHRLSIDTRYFAGRGVDIALDHHLCHMASAYYCAGHDEAVIVSVDGVGDLLSAVVGRGRGGDMEVTGRWFQSEQISGQSYEIVTAMLGFHPDKHPGKVTGLAAYADAPAELVDELDEWFRAQYRRGSDENWFHLIHTPDHERQLERLRELRHTRFGRWTREEISAAIQHMLERDVLALIRDQVAQPERRHIVLAGGVFANVKLNQRIKELGFRSVFVQPGMGDEGTGFGAALLAARNRQPFDPYRLAHVYLGPEYPPERIRTALNGAGLDFEELPGGRLERRLAELLDAGYIVARYQGRMEFGPRALGNRSILYNAKDPATNDWLNTQLRRSEFMPFAPVTLAEHAGSCYTGLAGAEHAAEFMTITFDATPEMRRQSPACVHVDGTARPQLVTRESNPSLHATLNHYHELSGVPSIINTSFNMHEEPIVCTPEEAVDGFLAAHLDALAIGDYLVVNESEQARARGVRLPKRSQVAAEQGRWIPERLAQLDELLRRHDYRGWDPFDLPNSPLFRPVRESWWLPQLALSKAGSRVAPDAVRRMLRVPEIEDPKIYACAYFAYRHRDPAAAAEMIDRLCALAGPDPYWGYDYTWATRSGEVNPRGASTIVPGSFALFALLDDHVASRGARNGALITAALDYYRTRHRSDDFFGYFAGSTVNTHNANLLGCAALTVGGRVLGRDDWLADAAGAAMTSARAVDATGYLPYADHASADWTDCFHHAYVIACLSVVERANPHVDRGELRDTLARLRRYLRAQFVRPDGLLNYYPGRLHPIDPHNYAVAAIFAVMFGEEGDIPPQAAGPLLRQVDSLMWDARRGRYLYRRHRRRRDSRLFLRWTQAWMFAALAVVDQERTRSRSSSESTRNFVAQLGN